MMKDLGRDSWKGECSARENCHNAEGLIHFEVNDSQGIMLGQGTRQVLY